MEHEDGYCDRCGAEIAGDVWLAFDGSEHCETCARNELYGPVRVGAKRPEARDDGR